MRSINRKINLIVIHCSATRVDKDYTPEQLERDHKARGFNSAGYNYYIREIVSMRPLELIPAHVTGYNKNSIGICYEGGLDPDGNPDDTRTEAQRQSIIRLLLDLVVQFPDSRICGHRDLSPDLNGNGKIEPDEWMKMCPCFNAEEEYRNI
jgi:N-acetylmuramoyl-L-alanine amidase